VSDKKTLTKIKTLGYALWRAFQIADCPEDIEPVFREAAEGGSDSGGAKWHGWAIRGLPGAKYHTMVGQVETSADVRRQRANNRNFRDSSLGRPDYYRNFNVH